jgi:hypothetical protein
MPLVDTRPPPSPLNVRPALTAVVAVACVVGFVIGLAVVARLTADDAPLYRAPVVVVADAGPPVDGGILDVVPVVDDAGVPAADDATAVVTVAQAPEGAVDAGPPSAPGPPFPPAAIVAAAVGVFEDCAANALRWDPSLGGPFVLVVDLEPLFSAREGSAPPRLGTPGLVSPVLARCLERRAGDVVLPPLGDVEVPLAIRARASLDVGGRITWSDVAVTTSAGPMDDGDQGGAVVPAVDIASDDDDDTTAAPRAVKPSPQPE